MVETGDGLEGVVDVAKFNPLGSGGFDGHVVEVECLTLNLP